MSLPVFWALRLHKADFILRQLNNPEIWNQCHFGPGVEAQKIIEVYHGKLWKQSILTSLYLYPLRCRDSNDFVLPGSVYAVEVIDSLSRSHDIHVRVVGVFKEENDPSDRVWATVQPLITKSTDLFLFGFNNIKDSPSISFDLDVGSETPPGYLILQEYKICVNRLLRKTSIGIDRTDSSLYEVMPELASSSIGKEDPEKRAIKRVASLKRALRRKIASIRKDHEEWVLTHGSQSLMSTDDEDDMGDSDEVWEPREVDEEEEYDTSTLSGSAKQKISKLTREFLLARDKIYKGVENEKKKHIEEAGELMKSCISTFDDKVSKPFCSFLRLIYMFKVIRRDFELPVTNRDSPLTPIPITLHVVIPSLCFLFLTFAG